MVVGIPPTPPSSIFCSRPNFRAATMWKTWLERERLSLLVTDFTLLNNTYMKQSAT